ncbi:MAG TPA: alpha/beta hydrolase [Anaerolineales bacterium]
MSSTAKLEKPQVPLDVNFVSRGDGSPIVLIHGLAASLHDWDQLTPALVASGYATHALDLLGHGDSAKPPAAFYELDWLMDHFVSWLAGLGLGAPAVLIGHSLGGYVALEYTRRHPDAVRALVLVDPFYSNGQLPWFLRVAYAHPRGTSFFMRRTPPWLVRWAIDLTSLLMGHRKGGLHALPEPVRAQTAADYMRTAPATYGILQPEIDLTPHLASIAVPTLVIWGEQDRTLTPASFLDLVKQLPKAVGKSSATGHVPHQAEAEWFTEQVLTFLGTLAEHAPETTPAGTTSPGMATGQ